MSIKKQRLIIISSTGKESEACNKDTWIETLCTSSPLMICLTAPLWSVLPCSPRASLCSVKQFSQGYRSGLIYWLIYWRLLAQSTAQGHLRAFHKVKSATSWIQYKTCTLYNAKHNKHNLKVIPFGIALIKKLLTDWLIDCFKSSKP